MKKFWKWKNQAKNQSEEEVTERILFLNGTIAEKIHGFDDDVTPQLLRKVKFREWKYHSLD